MAIGNPFPGSRQIFHIFAIVFSHNNFPTPKMISSFNTTFTSKISVIQACCKKALSDHSTLLVIIFVANQADKVVLHPLK